MNFNEALIILGLNNNYTEDELRKRYYALAKKYHPDVLINRTEEERIASSQKLKEINVAYEVLIKALKGRVNSQSSFGTNETKTVSELLNYMNQTISIISRYSMTNDPEIICDFEGFENMAELFELYNTIIECYCALITTALSKSEIDNIFKDFREKTVNLYEQLKRSYFSKYKIPEDTPFEINPNETFKEFYESLKQFRIKKSTHSGFKLSSSERAKVSQKIRERCIEKLKGS